MLMALATSGWTLAELDRLPDDGNRYELLDGELFVTPATSTAPESWADMPTPHLVVEILSGTTRRRDHEQKREFYLRIGVAEYWIVDRWSRSIRVVRADVEDVINHSALQWQPSAASEP